MTLKIKVRVTYCDPLFIMGCLRDKDTMFPFNHKTWDPARSQVPHKLGPRRDSQPGPSQFWPRGANGNHLGWDSGGLSMGGTWDGIQMGYAWVPSGMGLGWDPARYYTGCDSVGYAWVPSGMGFRLGPSWVPEVFPSGTLIISAAGGRCGIEFRIGTQLGTTYLSSCCLEGLSHLVILAPWHTGSS